MSYLLGGFVFFNFTFFKIFLDDYYIENGIIYQKETNNLLDIKQKDLSQSKDCFKQIIEETPNFNSNVCCGLCGSILTYELLINEHLPNIHPEVLTNGIVDLEEIPYEVKNINFF